MQTVDLITLAAVSTVVLLVSLPCLRDFAVRENERDAQRLLPVLSQLINRPVHAGASLGEALECAPRIAEGLRDARVGPDGEVLHHHGYVFRAGVPDTSGLRSLVAWPVEHARTGLRGFAYLPDSGLLEHPNEDGAWSGDSGPAPAPVPASGGWSAEPAP